MLRFRIFLAESIVMKLIKTSIIASLFALSAVNAQAETNLLINGSFEEPQVPGMAWKIFGSGSTAITGWTVVGADTQLTRTEFVPAAHGTQWIDLTGIYGYNKGLRSDAVATTIGQSYELSFDLGDYYAQGFQTATLGVSINGGANTLFTNIYEGGVMDWERKSFRFTATSASTNITFLGVENGALSNNAVIGLDNVVLNTSPVPEPSTYAMMLAGLFGVAAFARRKRG